MSKWKDVLKAVAPTVGLALGGPLGGLAAAVAGKLLLGDSKASVEDITKFIETNQDPDTLLKLKEVEAQFLLEMERIGLERDKLVIEEERISAGDRDSARKRESEVKDKTNQILAFTIIGGFLAMSYSVLFKEVSVDSALAGTIVGYMSAKAEQVLSYYFGSSMGSKLKTMLLDRKNDGNNKK